MPAEPTPQKKKGKEPASGRKRKAKNETDDEEDEVVVPGSSKSKGKKKPRKKQKRQVEYGSDLPRLGRWSDEEISVLLEALLRLKNRALLQHNNSFASRDLRPIARKFCDRWQRFFDYQSLANKWRDLKKAYTPYAAHLKHISGWNGHPAKPADEDVEVAHYEAHPECEPFRDDCPPFSEAIFAIIGSNMATGEHATNGRDLAAPSEDEDERGVESDDSEGGVDEDAEGEEERESQDVEVEEVEGSEQILRAAQLAKDNKERSKKAKRESVVSKVDPQYLKALAKMVTPLQLTVAALAKKDEQKEKEQTPLELVSERLSEAGVLEGVSDDDKDLLLMELSANPNLAVAAKPYLKKELSSRFESYLRRIIAKAKPAPPPTPPPAAPAAAPAQYQTHHNWQAGYGGSLPPIGVMQGGLHGGR